MKKFKNYIKENKSVEKFFFNGLNERTLEQKYQYIRNHFQYDIMNSWNNLKTIANNVKIYNLGLTNDQQTSFFNITETDEDFLYYETMSVIEEFEKLTECKIYFNGRSGGYIVIVPDFDKVKRNENILEYYNVLDVLYYDNYKDFKNAQNYYEQSNFSYKIEIEKAYYLIKAFDKFCDVLRSELIYILNNYKIEEHEEQYTKTVKEIVIN